MKDNFEKLAVELKRDAILIDNNYEKIIKIANTKRQDFHSMERENNILLDELFIDPDLVSLENYERKL